MAGRRDYTDLRLAFLGHRVEERGFLGGKMVHTIDCNAWGPGKRGR